MIEKIDKMPLLKELLKKNGELLLEYKGSSMKPFLKEGDAIFIEKVRADELKPGDVVSYFYKGEIVTHTLYAHFSFMGRRYLLLKGAANNFGDKPVKWPQVLGKATRIKRDGFIGRIDSLPVKIIDFKHWFYLLPMLFRKKIINQVLYKREFSNEY